MYVDRYVTSQILSNFSFMLWLYSHWIVEYFANVLSNLYVQKHDIHEVSNKWVAMRIQKSSTIYHTSECDYKG